MTFTFNISEIEEAARDNACWWAEYRHDIAAAYQKLADACRDLAQGGVRELSLSPAYDEKLDISDNLQDTAQCTTFSSQRHDATNDASNASTGNAPTTDTGTATAYAENVRPPAINSASNAEAHESAPATDSIPRPHISALSCISCIHQICTFPVEDKYAHSKGFPTTGCLECELGLKNIAHCSAYQHRPDDQRRKTVYR